MATVSKATMPDMTNYHLVKVNKHWIDTSKLNDDQYRRALELGIAAMLDSKELDLAKVKGK
jgi:hypothetical protein